MIQLIIIHIGKVFPDQILNSFQRAVLPCIARYRVHLIVILVEISMRQIEIDDTKDAFCFR